MSVRFANYRVQLRAKVAAPKFKTLTNRIYRLNVFLHEVDTLTSLFFAFFLKLKIFRKKAAFMRLNFAILFKLLIFAHLLSNFKFLHVRFNFSRF